MNELFELRERYRGTPVGSMVDQAIECVRVEHSKYARVVECDWRVAVENALEDLHVPYVHEQTFHRLGLSERRLVRIGQHSYASYRVSGKRYVESLPRLSKLFPYVNQVGALDYVHLFIYPNICLASVGGFTYSMQVYEELSRGRTQVTSRLYAGKTSRPMTGFFDEVARFNARVFDEDAVACERTLWDPQSSILSGIEQRLVWFREELEREGRLA